MKRIAPLEIADIENLVKLWLESFRFHASLDSVYYRSDTEQLSKQIRDYVKRIAVDPLKEMALAYEEDNSVVGFIIIEIPEYVYFDSRLEDCVVITQLFVADAARRKTWGKELVRHARSWALSHRRRHIKLEVAAGNAEALQFYQSLNFIPRQIMLHHEIRWDDPIFYEAGPHT